MQNVDLRAVHLEARERKRLSSSSPPFSSSPSYANNASSPFSPPPSKKKKPRTGVIDLCDSDDDEEAGDERHLAMARDHAMARKLQEDEDKAGGVLNVQPDAGDDRYLTALVALMRQQRMSVEGPPTAEQTVETYRDGTAQRMRRSKLPWIDGKPCVWCDARECQEQLRDLGGGSIILPANLPLLQMLCSWRRHVRETFIETRKPGETRWSKCSICTSELTFLGTKTEKGGVIGAVACAEFPVTSLASLAKLRPKGLSGFFVLLVALFMRWDYRTDGAVAALKPLLDKLRETKKQRDARGATTGRKGVETFGNSPCGLAMALALAKKKIPEKLREALLSRAHLP